MLPCLLVGFRYVSPADMQNVPISTRQSGCVLCSREGLFGGPSPKHIANTPRLCPHFPQICLDTLLEVEFALLQVTKDPYVPEKPLHPRH